MLMSKFETFPKKRLISKMNVEYTKDKIIVDENILLIFKVP
jgi:hypothetical protein